VADELLTISGHLTLLIQQGYSPSNKLMQTDSYIPLAEWGRNKDLLAEMLSDHNWESLPILYHNISMFRLGMVHQPESMELDEGRVRRLVDMITQAQAMAEILIPSEPDPDVRIYTFDAQGHHIPATS